jgi:hypothetical protein
MVMGATFPGGYAEYVMAQREGQAGDDQRENL